MIALLLANRRLVAEVAGVAVLILGFLWFVHYEREIGAEHERQAIEKAVVAENAKSALKEQHARDELQARSESYESRISQLQTAVTDLSSKPRVIVRQCPSRRELPEAPASTSRPSEETASGPTGADGVDLGTPLRAYAAECKALAIQLDEVLKAWPRG